MKKGLIGLALLLAAALGRPAAAEELTYNEPGTGALRKAKISDGRLLVDPGAPTRFTCSLSGVAAALTECQAAPAAGLRYYVTDIVVQTTTTTSGTYAVQTGTGTNCGTGTVALFPKASTAARFNAPISTQATSSISFVTPLVAAADHALCVIGTLTNTISIQISGYVAP